MKSPFAQTLPMFSPKSGRFAAAVIAACFLTLFAARLSAQDAPPANPTGAPDKSAGATLLKPSKAAEGGKGQMPKQEDSSLLGWIGSLLFVLGLFLAAVWLIRRTSPRAYGLLPIEAFEVLGRAPLANRQQAQLLRCGNKLLLIAASVGGAEPLTEITDPAEVERLTELCRKARPGPPAASLCQMFRKKEKQDG